VSNGNKSKESGIAESKKNFQRLYDEAPLAYQSLDIKGNIIEVNRIWLSTLGYTREEIIGKWFGDVVSDRYKERFKEIFPIFKKNGKIDNIEFQMRHKSGKILDVIFNGRILFDENNNFIRTLCIFKDITKNKELEKKIKEKEHYFRSLLFNLHEDILVINRDYIITDINNTKLLLNGYNREEVVGKHCYEILHGFDEPCKRHKINCRLHEVFKIGLPVNLKHNHLKKDGKKINVNILFSPLKDEKGNVTHVIEAVRDISDLLDTQKALKESEDRFKLFFENEPEYCYMISPDGKILDINDSALKILGYKKEELLGKPLLTSIYPPSTHQRMNAIFSEWKHTGEINNVKVKIKTKFNEIRTVLLSAGSIKDAAGNIICSISVQKDITEYEKTQQSLILSQQKYFELFDNMSSGVAVYEAMDNGNDFIFKDFNKAGEIIEKIKKEELIGKRVTEIFPGVKEFGLFDVFRKVWKTGKAEHHPASFYRDNRISGWRENFVYKLPSGEIVAVYNDTTEKREAEEQIKKDLQEKIVLLQEIHHRVKNNMQIISSLLSIQSAHIKDKKIRTLFYESRNRIHTMALIHEQLYGTDDLSSIDIKEYVKTAVHHLFSSYSIDPARIKLRYDMIDMKFDINIAIPLGLIINELVTNSIKHAFPENRKGEIRIGFRILNNIYELLVCDNGIGLSSEIKIEETTSLGLQLVNVLVKQINGKIKIIRKKGARFIITFKKIELHTYRKI